MASRKVTLTLPQKQLEEIDFKRGLIPLQRSVASSSTTWRPFRSGFPSEAAKAQRGPTKEETEDKTN